MFKCRVVIASAVLAGMWSATTMAALVGGGSPLLQGIYNDPGVFPMDSAPYRGVGNGAGKVAFLNNSALNLGLPAGTAVHYAASDTALASSELGLYNAAHNAIGIPSADNWGPVIQIPSFGTSVAIAYKRSGIGNLDLTSAQLCRAFSGQVSTWGALLGNSDPAPIRVIYRIGSSGTSAILSRHLNSQCPELFNVSTNFVSALLNAVPANWVGVETDSALASTVAATEGSIGYVGPETLDPHDNAVVARLNGLLPAVGPVVTALSTVEPPVGAARNNPANWAIELANPAIGYKLVAFTYLDIGQCYQSPAITTQMRAFLSRHYGLSLNNDAYIVSHRFIPLTAVWKAAIRSTFLNGNSALAVGDANTCNGIGRPL